MVGGVAGCEVAIVWGGRRGRWWECRPPLLLQAPTPPGRRKQNKRKHKQKHKILQNNKLPKLLLLLLLLLLLIFDWRIFGLRKDHLASRNCNYHSVLL